VIDLVRVQISKHHSWWCPIFWFSYHSTEEQTENQAWVLLQEQVLLLFKCKK